MLTAKVPKTIDDLLKLPPETRAELLEGEIIMSPSPSSRHQRFVRNLAAELIAFVRRRKLGEIFFAPLDVVLSRHAVAQPDILFVSTKRSHIISDRIEGAPDLVVEVVSSGSEVRDRVVKRNLYARHRVREYWIVDLEERTVEVLKLRGSKYILHALFEPGDAITSPLLPNLSLSLDPLFE